jgi:hypothetical protein
MRLDGDRTDTTYVLDQKIMVLDRELYEKEMEALEIKTVLEALKTARAKGLSDD